jgi:histone H3/H4
LCRSRVAVHPVPPVCPSCKKTFASHELVHIWSPDVHDVRAICPVCKVKFDVLTAVSMLNKEGKATDDEETKYPWYCPAQLSYAINHMQTDGSAAAAAHWLTVLQDTPEVYFSAITHYGTYAAAIHVAKQATGSAVIKFHTDPRYVAEMWKPKQIAEFYESSETNASVSSSSSSSSSSSAAVSSAKSVAPTASAASPAAMSLNEDDSKSSSAETKDEEEEEDDQKREKKKRRRTETEKKPAIPRQAFDRVVRETATASTGLDSRYRKGSVDTLQDTTEELVSDLFAASNLVAKHAKRKTVTPKDVAFIQHIRNHLL